ncbi:sensor histidine kinase [Ruania zhangjianzhongii]|uniref:sensor histidine kinase n=1 Tax=Ruania zhangjianzhongii TaxID=2603206 RepID=UPI001FD361A5|nr:HAMP domain-containing sensor histidine kinase [Ruania zhangjianzhongii]
MASKDRQWRMSVRTRALAALIGLAALAMAAAGMTAYSLERDHTARVMDESLLRNADEIRTLHEQGVDPATGDPFASVEAVLRTALSRVVPAENEAVAGFMGAELSQVPSVFTSFRIQDDPELLAAVAPVSTWSSADIMTVDTDQRSYRVLGLPVQSGGDGPDGAVVLAFDLDAEFAQLNNTFGTYALVAVVALVWITVIGWFVVGRMLLPVTVLRTTAAEISSSDDLSRRVPVTGKDDLAALSETVNGMFARLEHTFASQRQLLDDVGHELRTPLTVVRGHLELMDPTDAADAADTQALVLDEVDRMNLLVEDLMTLAKARRPDFVTLIGVDMALLTDEVLAKAQPLGERRWVLDSLADVQVEADPRRLTQAWLQLVSNAVKFSAEGSTVAIGSRYSPSTGTVRLWVRDEGAGIEPEDQARIFERFERLNPSVDGTGLGLSIVSLIAEAHGGQVDLESTVGAGSTFSIVLPLSPSEAPQRSEERTTR